MMNLYRYPPPPSERAADCRVWKLLVPALQGNEDGDLLVAMYALPAGAEELGDSGERSLWAAAGALAEALTARGEPFEVPIDYDVMTSGGPKLLRIDAMHAAEFSPPDAYN